MKYFLTVFILFSLFTFAIGDKPSSRPNSNIVIVQNNNVLPPVLFNVVFVDSFNRFTNYQAGLEARGWKCLNVDNGGTTFFFGGNATVFTSFEGPDTGYVAENYNGANGYLIDQWLISPPVTVAAGDTLSFYHRSTNPGSTIYPDSFYVKVAANAGITPADFTYSFGKFRAPNGPWQRWKGNFPAGGTIRFAIQYHMWDGGPLGGSSDFVGFDLVQVINQIVPVELTSFTAKLIDQRVVLNWSTATETNNKGFEIYRKAENNKVEYIGFVAGNGTTTEKINYSFTDKLLSAGKYSYQLKQIDFDGKYSLSNEVLVDLVKPNSFSLEQNYPNPFNPTTNIKVGLAVDSKVTLKVFNIIGQEVASLVNGNLSAGNHSINFNASGLNSGVYFAKIEAVGNDGNNFSSIIKMILNK